MAETTECWLAERTAGLMDVVLVVGKAATKVAETVAVMVAWSGEKGAVCWVVKLALSSAEDLAGG
jgi:hypothetical protein